MEYLINIANILYLLSYFVRDMLWLRVLTVVAALSLIGYFYFLPEPLMTAVYWNLFFVAMNLYWVIRLVAERKLSVQWPSLHELLRLQYGGTDRIPGVR